MRFYFCETTPPTIARTQADAKATGASFGTLDIPNGHVAATTALNELVTRVAGTAVNRADAGPVQADEEEAVPTPPKPRTPAPATNHGWHGNDDLVLCPHCLRTEAASKALALNEDRAAITAIVADITDLDHLVALEKIIADHRATVKPKPVVVNPPARKRRA